MRASCFVRAVLVVVLGCSMSCGTDGENDEGPTEFRGTSFHFDLKGSYGGEPLEISLSEADASDVEKAWCKRHYIVDDPEDSATWSDGELDEYQVHVYGTLGGEPRLIRFEFKRHPFQDAKDGVELTVVPRDDSKLPTATQTWIEVELEDLEGNELVEDAARDGKMVLGAYTGEPGADGLVIPAGTGAVGAFFDARWSATDSFTGSFYVKCGENEIEAPE